MFHKYLPAIFALVFLAASGAGAKAQFGFPDVYVAAGAGGGILDNTDVDSIGTSFETEPFPGYALSGALGLDFGLLRVEGELFYNVYDLDTIKDAGINLDADGSFKTLAGMGNVFLDVPLAVVTPFVGAGIGYADVKADNFQFNGTDLVDDSDTVMAWQLRAGIAFAVFPFTDMTIGYRYFVTDDLAMSNSLGDVDIEKLKSHILELGLRISF
jgi:opacity protein-like surface antigen